MHTYEIVANEDWRIGGNWALVEDGETVMVNDDKRILAHYAYMREKERDNLQHTQL